jgi:NADP-dependent 3-hydroxy acid dehydrogenase YdfG
MNRIILAYSQHATAIAHHIDSQLSRIGIPFEHSPSNVAGFSTKLLALQEPLLLIVTDNLLKDHEAMLGLFDALKKVSETQKILPVLADGVDESGNAVPTNIDRMVNMLYYMNHWQGVWMALSAEAHEASGPEKEALERKMAEVRSIANEVSELIALLKELEIVDLQQFESKDYALFFKSFDLADWHGQYRKVVAQALENQAAIQLELLPDAKIESGFLSPEPVEVPDLPVSEIIQEPASSEPVVEVEEIPVFEASVQEFEKVAPETDLVDLTVRDAEFWIERGHVDRGLELLKIALEEYPQNTKIAQAYQKALSDKEPTTPEPTDTPPTAREEAYSAPENLIDQSNNLQSYELMGDLALEKGEYLFAKYCWDRVVELDPNRTDIYRKLGLMTAEYLHDYRETAVHYLSKALEQNPADEPVKRQLELLSQNSPEQPELPETEKLPEPPSKEAEPLVAAKAPTHGTATVLITGATSGIGRATAEIFAKNGYRLVLTGRRVERLVEVQKHLENQYQSDVLLLPFDVRDSGAVEAALENLPESFQRIDVLINNAGLAKGLSPIHEGSLEHWETMIDTNVKGLLYVTRLVSKGMVARKQGQIINVCSSAGKEAYPNGIVYCSTKFAVDALTKSIRFDLHAHNIRVGQVSPGHVEETEFAVTRFDGDTEKAKIYSDFQPLKASDVAEAIYFMATRPAYVNIQDIQMFATQQASSMVINRSGRADQ